MAASERTSHRVGHKRFDVHTGAVDAVPGVFHRLRPIYA